MTRRQRSYPVAPPGLWDREDMRSALAARDMGAVITIFRRWTGASQTDIGVLLGMPQPHVSDFERGIRHATSLAMFERLADGLGIPRPLLGLADSQHDHAEAEPGRTREKPSRETPAIRSVDFVAWLAEQSKTSFRVLYDRLAARIQQLARIPDPDRSHRAYQYGRVTREQVVTALAQYYRTPLPTDCSFYNVQVDGTTLPTTVLTRPGWMSTRIPLGAEAERFEYVSPSLAPIPPPHLDGDALTAAINRLATAELSSTVLTNDPLYRLLRIAVQPARLDASVTSMSFADYALTMDLLESELIETLAEENTAASPRARSRRLPLRDAYLPSVMHALDLERRICAGGPVTLLAAARPANAIGRKQPDYARRYPQGVPPTNGRAGRGGSPVHIPLTRAGGGAVRQRGAWQPVQQRLPQG
jgi:transcriptional regulator with XRE-family HTH domain